MTQPTFLLDLDDTLLSNSMAEFLPAYFNALNQRLAPYLGGQNLRQAMSAAVQVTQANQNPTVTNLEAFMADFTRRINVDPATLNPILAEFYRVDFPHLRAFTSRRRHARPLVELLLAAGCTVVIATNPLFPAVAVGQRLAWAGLNNLEFALVTSMENSHYSKPNPNYYREILQKVGGAPDSAWMVGDDWERDIVPAQSLGLRTWWITDHLPAPVATPPLETCYGLLSEFLSWVKAQPFAAI